MQLDRSKVGIAIVILAGLGAALALNYMLPYPQPPPLLPPTPRLHRATVATPPPFVVETHAPDPIESPPFSSPPPPAEEPAPPSPVTYEDRSDEEESSFADIEVPDRPIRPELFPYQPLPHDAPPAVFPIVLVWERKRPVPDYRDMEIDGDKGPSDPSLAAQREHDRFRPPPPPPPPPPPRPPRPPRPQPPTPVSPGGT